MTTTERNERIVQLAADGWTLAAIGTEVGLTRERVRQILNDHGTRTLRHDDLLAKAAADWRASGQVRHAHDVLREHRLAANSRNIAMLRRAVPELCLPASREQATTWTEGAIVSAVRDLARQHGFDFAGGWMRLKDYTRLRGPHDPAPATIGANFLWSDIAVKAGFNPANAPRRGRRGGTRPRQIAQADLDNAVLDYIGSGERLSAAGFEQYLKDRPHLPSMATIRNRFRAEGINTIAGIFTDVQERLG
jgi:hypothetical protein